MARRKELTAKQWAWVRAYTDPSLPCYLSPRNAAKVAGLGADQGNKIATQEQYAHVMAEVQKVFDLRQEAGRDMLEIMHDSRLAAIDNLAKSIRAGQALRMINPEEEFGKGAGDVMEVIRGDDGNPMLDGRGNPVVIDQSARFREINKHNTNVLKAMQEARLAAMDLLSYVLGKPEQVIRHKDDKNLSANAIAELGDEDLDALIRQVERESVKRLPVAEAEVLEISSPDEAPEQ
jgi:hypothetical protein